MKKYIGIIMLCTILLVACSQASAGKNRQPNWITNPESEYPNSLYMTAVGQGDSRNEAEKRAIGNLAQIFKAEVSVEETVTESYEELMSSGEIAASGSSSMESAVSVNAEQTLQNVQIGESYTDDLGRVYVLAYLDRMQTATIYETQIEENNRRIVDFQDLAQTTSGNPAQHYALLNAAHIIARQNVGLLAQLNIISPTSREMMQLPYQADQLAQERAASAKKISFFVEIQNDQNDKVTNLIKEELADLGFVSVANANALLQLRGDVLFEPVDLDRQGQKFVRWVLNLSVLNAQAESIINLTKSGREGHLNEAEAQARALRTIASIIQKEVQGKIVQYFNRLAMQTQN